MTDQASAQPGMGRTHLCPETSAALAKLRPHFGERISESVAVREQHASQLTWIAPQPPDAVIHAESTQGQGSRFIFELPLATDEAGESSGGVELC